MKLAGVGRTWADGGAWSSTPEHFVAEAVFLYNIFNAIGFAVRRLSDLGWLSTAYRRPQPKGQRLRRPQALPLVQMVELSLLLFSVVVTRRDNHKGVLAGKVLFMCVWTSNFRPRNTTIRKRIHGSICWRSKLH